MYPPPPLGLWEVSKLQMRRQHLTITLPLGSLSTATIIYRHFIITASRVGLSVAIFRQALCSETCGGMKACKCESCLACSCTEASRPSSICSLTTLQFDKREKKEYKNKKLVSTDTFFFFGFLCGFALYPHANRQSGH